MKNEKPEYYSGWLSQFGDSEPIETIADFDKEPSYEMDRAVVFKLKNGKYAYVHESGCSCYESSDAMIDIYDTKKEAMEQFNAWKGN